MEGNSTITKKQELDCYFAFNQISKHEIEMVKNAIQKYYRNIISVNGSGILHRVVNGAIPQRYVKSIDLTIAVMPLGIGND
jgi:diacylglycerol kinase family enzyme